MTTSRPWLGISIPAWLKKSDTPQGVNVLVDRAVAVPPSVDDDAPAAWRAGFEEMFGQVVASAFYRREPRLRARRFLLGLLSGLERKNGWTLAEFAGDATPDGMQRLLNAARWDADAVCDDLRGYVAAHLGDEDRAAVLTIDDTGFAKKGRSSAGVQRQYSGTLGRIDNCQIGVFLGYVTGRGRALLDRELYLPKSWTSEPARLEAAGIEDDMAFSTKPQLAWQMIQRAIDAGLAFGWVTGDEAYGDNGPLRRHLEDRGVPYVLAVSKDHHMPQAGGTLRADALAATLPEESWQRYSAGPGVKGDRSYHWAWIAIAGHHHLLARRSISTGERAFYRCYAPRGASLPELVRVAGSRWSIEECFQGSKTETGLDHYQVRKYMAWYRHITLSMCAHAFLAAMAATAQTPVDNPENADLTGGNPQKGASPLWIRS